MPTLAKCFSICLLLLGMGLVACGTEGLQGPQTEGNFKIETAFEASSLTTGQNTMSITVMDQSGAPIKGATITVYPHMPAHGHGSTEEPKLEDMGEGKYKAHPITFQMPGEWEIIVKVDSNGEKGKYTFTVQVQ